MPSAKAWTVGDPEAPAFPDDFAIARKAVLQVTDIKTNRNKYYAIEVHVAQVAGLESYRVFTHYGRTDDLETNPDAGQKECRFFATAIEAQAAYDAIFREKTNPRKGYKEISLASSRIGSSKARGASSGEVDEATLRRIAKDKSQGPSEPPAPVAPEPLPVPAPAPPSLTTKLKRLFGGRKQAAAEQAAEHAAAVQAAALAAESTQPFTTQPSTLHPRVRDLVAYIYGEATSALTSTVAVKITAQGIETPLGILTIGQIEKGEAILQELYAVFQKKKREKAKRDEMTVLSGEFYTVVPHRIGRTRAAIEGAVIDSLEAFEQKQETLQLMKDMLQVDGEGGGVLFRSEVDAQYEALKCDVTWHEPASDTHKAIAEFVVKSQIKSKSIRVSNVFSVRRQAEWDRFAAGMGNQRLLFHGSRIKNWVGILSRGILLPKIVVSLGVHRTDAGWLGNGMYFGDAACTSAFYTSPGKRGTRLLSVARVALGRMKDYHKITYGLNAPPDGYDSCHGVRHTPAQHSQFADDEYVVYQNNQQKLEYLVEFKI